MIQNYNYYSKSCGKSSVESCLLFNEDQTTQILFRISYIIPKDHIGNIYANLLHMTTYSSTNKRRLWPYIHS